MVEGGPPIGVPECVSYAAVEGLDPLCCETIDLLMEIMASYLQRAVLTLAPVPGAEVYVSGGVSNYLAAYFKKREDHLWEKFTNHPQMSGLLRQAKIYVLTQNPTLDGL